MNYNCSNLLNIRNFQEQVKKAFCCQKLFWPFTVWINCSSDLKFFANSRPSASKIKSFFQSLEQFFLTVGQNNFGNTILTFLHAVKKECYKSEWAFIQFSSYPPKWAFTNPPCFVQKLLASSSRYRDCKRKGGES